MMELLVLGLLKEAPLHGYELKRHLESIVGYFGAVSYGSLYPMLHKLEAQGHVRKILEKQRRKERITYQINPKGERHFLQLMRATDAPLTLKMLFFQSLPSRERKLLLERQRAEWISKLDERKRVKAKIARRPVDHYQSALLARSLEHLRVDVAWIQNLVAEEGRANPA